MRDRERERERGVGEERERERDFGTVPESVHCNCWNASTSSKGLGFRV
jgi:hypothetical protein